MPHNYENTDIPCPSCGKPLRHFSWGYSCPGYSSGECKFGIGYTIAHKEFSDSELRELLTEMSQKGQTDLIHGFKSKKGTEFSAALVPTADGIQFQFPKPDLSSLTCPLCGKPLSIRSWGYSCSGYPQCNFSISSICKHKFTEDEVAKLLNGEEIYITNMISKKGNTFDAFVSFDANQEHPFGFRFDDKDSLF